MIHELGTIKQSTTGTGITWSARHVLEDITTPTEDVLQCEKMIVHAVNGATGRDATNHYVIMHDTTFGYDPIDLEGMDLVITQTIAQVS